MNRAWLTAGVVAVVLGCGSEKDKAPFRPMGTPKDRDAAADEEVDTPVGGDAGTPSGDGPVLELVAPSAARDPVGDTVLTARDVTVRCKVTQRPGGVKVDASSVKITLDTGMREVTAPVTPEGDEYIASFDLGDLPNGSVRFRCEAKDLAADPHSASLTLATLLDLGPTIEILKPKEKDVKALRTPTAVRFRVTPAPLAESDDSEAEVKDVQLRISGVMIPVSETEGEPGLYQTTVDFDDKTLFEVTPTDAEVLVTARNARSPEAPTRSARVSFLVDGAKPSIRVDSPLNNSLVHGRVDLKLTITDAAGVDLDTVRAEITSPHLILQDWKVSGSTYTHSFDTGRFPLDVVQVYIEIRASDIVGNEQGISHTLYIDDVAPVLSLDPPEIRERRKVSDNTYYCSELFDPVGADAMSDGQIGVGTQSMYRVLVEDTARAGYGSRGLGFYAGVKADTVKLYARKNLSVPLLIDTNMDGVCDEINNPDNGTKPLLLTALETKGTSWWSKTVNLSGIPAATCTADPGGPDIAPPTLCEYGTEMTRAVMGRQNDKPRAVYAYSPTNTNVGACEGLPWELSNAVAVEGAEWVCVTARAEDNIGNVGVAEPIRVCLSESGGSCTGPAPDCHVGCEITDWQRFESHAIWYIR